MLDECINNSSAKFSGVMVRSVNHNHNHKKRGAENKKEHHIISNTIV